MTNSDRTYTRYTGLIGANVLSEFRAISGFPSHRLLHYSVNNLVILDFLCV